MVQKSVIDIKHKTGFESLEPKKPIIIRDFRGRIFYDTRDLQKPVLKFNLPEGKYSIESGTIKAMPDPVKFSLSKLPKPERYYSDPTTFKIVFGINPNKCSIIWKKKTILFDNAFKSALLPEIFFILYHEYGHSLYKTEKYADLFSTNKMLKKGYNNSQIGKAHITSLSERQVERKNFITNKVLKRQKYDRSK
jgi:hypothetical protein